MVAWRTAVGRPSDARAAIISIAAVIIAAGILAMGHLQGAYPETASVISIAVDRPILLLNASPSGETATRLSVWALDVPPHARLTYAWSQGQDVLNPVAPSKGKLIRCSAIDAVTTTCFPDWRSCPIP